MSIRNTPPEYNKYENSKRLREGLENHILFVADKVACKVGRINSLQKLEELLAYNEAVRFPASIEFDKGKLHEGEPVRVDRVSPEGEEKYIITLHPCFKGREEDIIALVLYSIVKINYGKIAKEEEAQLFASTVLGIDRDEYGRHYERLTKEV